MLISENALNMLVAKTYKGIGRKWINDNLKGAPSAEEIVERLKTKVDEVSLCDFETKRIAIRRKVEDLGDAIDGLVGLGDDEFPELPARIKAADRPVALFYRGNVELLRKIGENVAVIGLLNPDDGICADEVRVVEELVKRRGKCIVSGLALGCDTIGHEVAVRSGGKTIAFLSSPLDEVNPPSNRPLAERIVEAGGLLVSEYYDKAHSRNEFLARYPERDRLQAMFASVVILSASYAPGRPGCDSGSRFAMGKAVEYGVPRAVIYNEVNAVGNAMYDMNRSEMREGAIMIDPCKVHEMHLPDKLSNQTKQETLFGV